MMRSKIVTVNGKSIKVQEKRIGELEELINNTLGNVKTDDLNNAINKEINFNTVFEILYDKLTEIFPELTQDDIKNAYPSELENLVQAFIDVNFFGIKKIIPGVMNLISLMQKQ